MKKIIILFVAFFYSFQAPAHANPFLMDFETYVHLEQPQKEEFVRNFMLLVVEIEENYEKQKRTSNYSPEQHEKFKRLVSSFLDLMISSAHAQGKDDFHEANFNTFSQQFKNFLDPAAKTFKQDKCIYAGWVSKMIDGYCQHPSAASLTKIESRTKKTDDPLKAAYKANSKDSKCADTEVACNPVVFGYKVAASKSLFCVYSAADSAHNASYDCMRQSLRAVDKVKEKALYDKLVATSDDPSVRMKYLSEQMGSAKNRDAFNSIHGYLFDSCICQKDDSKTAITLKYRNYMRPHRTCFGLMNSMREIHRNCDLNGEGNTSTFSQMNAFFRTQWKEDYNYPKLPPANKNDTVNKTFGGEYSKLIEDKDFRDKFCPFIKPETCKTTCGEEKVIDGKSEWECEITEYISNGAPVKLDPKPKVKVTKFEDQTIEFPNKPGLTCPIKLEKKAVPKADETICKITCSDAKNDKNEKTGSLNCEVKEATKNGQPLADEWKTKFPTFDPKKFVIEEKLVKDNLYKLNEVDCTVTKLDDNACKPTVTVAADGKTVTAEVSFPNDPEKKFEVTWPEGFSAVAPDLQKATRADWDGKAVVLKFSDKATGKIKCEFPLEAKKEEADKLSCEIDQSGAKNADETYTFTIKPTPADAEVVSVTWTPENKDAKLVKESALISVKGIKDPVVKAKAKLKFNGKEEEVPCTDKIVDLPKKGEKGFSIKVKGNVTTETNKQVIVTSITTPDNEEGSKEIPADYEVRWVRGAATDLTFPKANDADDASTSTESGIPDDPKTDSPESEESEEEKAKREKLKDAEPKDSKDFAGGGKKVDAGRKSEHSYYMVAQLVHTKSGKVVAESERIKIPKKPGSYTPTQVQRPQPMMRQKIDTWTNKKL